MTVPKALRIIEYGNPRMLGDYTPYAFQKLDEPQLKELRERYNLEKVVEKGKTEFKRLLLLKRWVRSRWKHGWSDVEKGKPNNALTLLAEGEKGKNFACWNTALTYIQCCHSLGYQARYVGILRSNCDVDTKNVGHAITEVWSNDFGKWVVMDPDLNVHYEWDGIPLNALEIREAWLKGEVEKVQQVKAEPLPELAWDEVDSISSYEGLSFKEKVEKLKRNNDFFVSNKNMHFYEYVVIPMRNDYFATGEAKKTKTYMFGDRLKGPILFYIQRELVEIWPDLEFTSNPDDMYFSINQTFIDLRAKNLEEEPATFQVKLINNMPSFDRYEIKLDGGQWKIKPEQFEWKLKSGMNTIEARAVNKLQKPGIPSKITVEYKS